ncbi:MAG TPA: hypothetical protein VE130_06515 [Nitrososphaeraceae archaeon]|nr:hypothetical protein [Nitrososphaeraceae archaeon]
MSHMNANSQMTQRKKPRIISSPFEASTITSAEIDKKIIELANRIREQ